MKRASISRLKAKLSQYLDAVRGGEEVLVTDRGRPVARLAPVRGEEEEERRRDWLLRTGRLRPPRVPLPHGFFDEPRPSDPEGRSLLALLEERERGR
jgi:prevent-host-death family protein